MKKEKKDKKGFFKEFKIYKKETERMYMYCSRERIKTRYRIN